MEKSFLLSKAIKTWSMPFPLTTRYRKFYLTSFRRSMTHGDHLFCYRSRDKIVTGSFDKTASVWCSRTGHCLLTFWGHDGEVVVAKFSPTGNKVATGSLDGTSRIFNLTTGKIIKPLDKFLMR